MGISQIYPWGLGAGANVATPAAFNAAIERLTGFVSGKASSQMVNTALRQALYVSSMIAAFTAEHGQTDVLDNGDIAGFIAQFEDALGKFVRSIGVNIGPEPPDYPVDGMLWLNTGNATYQATFDRIPPGGLAIFYGLDGWHWLCGGQRLFVGQQLIQQTILPTTMTSLKLSGNPPPWGNYDASTGKLTVLVAGEYQISFQATVNVSFNAFPPAALGAFAAQISVNGTSIAGLEVPASNAGTEPDGTTPGYIFAQSVSMSHYCNVNDVIEGQVYLWNSSDYIQTAFAMDGSALTAARLS